MLLIRLALTMTTATRQRPLRTGLFSSDNYAGDSVKFTRRRSDTPRTFRRDPTFRCSATTWLAQTSSSAPTTHKSAQINATPTMMTPKIGAHNLARPSLRRSEVHGPLQLAVPAVHLALRRLRNQVFFTSWLLAYDKAEDTRPDISIRGA